MKEKPKILEYSVDLVIIAIGIALLTCFVSVRSWYKPSIELMDISPITIKLNKDVKVEDLVKTNENKEQAKLEAIRNTGNREILAIDKKAIKASVDKLNFLISISRQEVNPTARFEIAINDKVTLDTQDAIRLLEENEWNEFKVLVNQLPENIDRKPYDTYLSELNRLIEIERQKYIEEMTKLRSKDSKIKEEKEALGRLFFEDLKKSNPEYIFAQSILVQKKLLELGIVSGIPKSQIKKDIRILFPSISGTDRNLIQKLVLRSLIPNLVIDWEKVHELEDEAMESVKPTIVKLPQGTTLAQKGKKVEEREYYFLKELNMLHAQPDWKEILENLVLIVGFVLLMSLFFIATKLKRFRVEELLMIVVVPLGLAATLAVVSIWGIDKLIIVPFATMSILLTVFYAPIIAATLSTLMAFFMIKSFDLNLWQVLPLYIGSIYGIFLTRKAHQREDLTRAGTRIAICQMVVFATTIVVAAQDFKIIPVLILALFYGASGILSGFATIAILPYLESGLRLLTPFRLIELSNPNQSLLKKLREEAPGTYQHSMSVTSFSEEACRAIGGDVELLRVGLLYHDCGKTYKPDYFIENQFGNPNPHTTLDDPLESAKIIIDHVPEGIKLAKKFNLPQSIIDYIPMHQGHTVTGYFYQKACEKFGKENVNQNDFRYPGPSPDTKETGIAMLADSVEATLHSHKGIEENEALNIINKIITARLNEGELDNSGLNRTELNLIAEAFLKVWKTKNHQRIKYPENKEN